MLLCNRLIELGVLVPSAGNVAELSLTDLGLAQANAADQSFDSNAIKTLALSLCASAQL
jgi:hypothetical protein